MRRKSGRIALATTSILCSLILAACNCAPTLRYVSVAPTSATIFAAAIVSGGETSTTTILPCTTQQFAATGYYSDGSQKDISSIAGWGSSNSNAATITTAGLASSVAAVGATGGTSVISATAGGATASANLAVDILTSIAVTPAAKTVPLGGSQQYAATGTFTTPGSTTPTKMDITSLVAWSVTGGTTSSDGSKNANSNASIGTATGLLATTSQDQLGATNVIATLCTMSGTTTVTIGAPTAKVLQITPDSPSIAVGQTVDLSATIINTDGSKTYPVPTAVTWTSATTTVASITSNPASPFDGLATGLTAGTSVITATMGTGASALTATTTLTVAAAVARFAYVPGKIDGSFSGFAPHGASGGFTSLGKTPAVEPQQAVVHPSGSFLYAINGDSTISVYDIDPLAGELTNSGQTPTAIPSGATHRDRAVLDSTGSWLFVADFDQDKVFAYSINQGTGALTAIGSGTATGTGPMDVLITPSGKFLYVVNNTGNSVSAYSVASGVLTSITGPTTTLNSPEFSAIDPSGTYLFVPNSANNSVIPFTIGSAGGLTAGTAFTVTGATFLNAAAVDPTSKFLYVEDSPSGNGKLFALSIGAGGALTATINSGNPYPLGDSPMGVAVDPTGKIVAVANSLDNTLSVFTAASSGALTPDSLVQTGASPEFPVFARGTAEATSSVAAIVAANSTAGTLSAFTQGSTGALSAVNTTPFVSLAGNSQIAVSQSSVFTSSASAKELGGYTVNPASSTATFAQIAVPISTTGAAGGVTTDATGNFAYVVDSTNNVVRSFNSNLSSNSSTAAITGGVLALATDPQSTLVYALGTNSITPLLTSANAGTLTPLTSGSFPGTWAAGAVSPGGKFLAAVDSSTNKIQIFTITPVRGAGPASDGKLTAVGTGLSIPGAKTASSVAFDPLGRFLVVTDSVANSVTPFTISSTGSLTAGTALTTPTGATSAVIDPNGLWLFVGVFGNPTATPAVVGGVQVYSIATSGALTAVGTPVSADKGTWGVGVVNTVQ